MSLVCLWNPRWRTAGAPLAELGARLLAEAPRVAVEAPRGLLWADVRGLPAPRLAWALLRCLGESHRPGTRAGVAAVPVAAEVAARTGEAPVAFVESGHERAFLAPHPLSLLEPDAALHALLAGVGIERFGELAALERAAVEVRFGAGAVALWRLARADDRRILFRPLPRERPHASFEFVEYEVRSAAGLLFVARPLLESLCRELAGRGELARTLVLEIPLTDRTVWTEPLRAARPTAQAAAWLRRLRDRLDRLVLPDAATGIALRVEATEDGAARAPQGDLFDRGFASAAAAEAALGRLIDRFGELFVVAERSADPLPERRTVWAPRRLEALLADRAAAPRPGGDPAPALELQLLAEPRPVVVRARPRRDHLLPVAYREGGEWRTLLVAAGPQRISGGLWHEEPYAREYFRCVSATGAVLWLFRDARTGTWYLHGWWD